MTNASEARDSHAERREAISKLERELTPTDRAELPSARRDALNRAAEKANAADVDEATLAAYEQALRDAQNLINQQRAAAMRGETGGRRRGPLIVGGVVVALAVGIGATVAVRRMLADQQRVAAQQSLSNLAYCLAGEGGLENIEQRLRQHELGDRYPADKEGKRWPEHCQEHADAARVAIDELDIQLVGEARYALEGILEGRLRYPDYLWPEVRAHFGDGFPPPSADAVAPPAASSPLPLEERHGFPPVQRSLTDALPSNVVRLVMGTSVCTFDEESVEKPVRCRDHAARSRRVIGGAHDKAKGLLEEEALERVGSARYVPRGHWEGADGSLTVLHETSDGYSLAHRPATGTTQRQEIEITLGMEAASLIGDQLIWFRTDEEEPIRLEVERLGRNAARGSAQLLGELGQYAPTGMRACLGGSSDPAEGTLFLDIEQPGGRHLAAIRRDGTWSRLLVVPPLPAGRLSTSAQPTLTCDERGLSLMTVTPDGEDGIRVFRARCEPDACRVEEVVVDGVRSSTSRPDTFAVADIGGTVLLSWIDRQSSDFDADTYDIDTVWLRRGTLDELPTARSEAVLDTHPGYTRGLIPSYLFSELELIPRGNGALLRVERSRRLSFVVWVGAEGKPALFENERPFKLVTEPE